MRDYKYNVNIEAENGGGFVQMIYRDHTFYPLEFGYRLDGVGSWMTRKLTVRKNKYTAVTESEKIISINCI